MTKGTKAKSRGHIPLPERFAVSGTEENHQIALFCWAALPDVRQKYPELRWMFAIPNGGFRHKREAGRLKAGGVKAGVPDIMLPIKRGQWSGLVIELKRPKVGDKRAGQLRGEQGPWLDHFQSQGYGSLKCTGWEHARDTIINYLEWKE